MYQNLNDDKQAKKIIGNRFREFRKSILMSRTNMGRHLNLTYNSIANFETGRLLPGTGTLLRLYTEFKLNPLWLVAGDGPMIHGKSGDEDYDELFKLIKIPFIKQIIFARLIEAKKYAEILNED